MSKFTNLKSSIKAKKIKLLTLISCPRSSSTILASSLLRSPTINAYCHEPFTPLSKIHFKPELLKERTDASYENLLKIIRKAQSNDVILTKEMSSWVGLHTKEYENFFELCYKPIIFLIRNPYLSSVSRLKKLIKTLDMRYKESITTTIISLLGFKYRRAEFSLEYQKDILEQYAKSENFTSWKALVEYTCDSEDFSHVNEFLINLDIYNNAFSGFSAIKEQIEFLKENSLPYIILDSTIFRLFPLEVLKQLCSNTSIEFSQNMLAWKNDNFKIDLGSQQSEYQKIWYTRAQNSKNIEPPSESLKDTLQLPKHIRKYIEYIDLPIYKELLHDDNLIKPAHFLSKLEKIIVNGKSISCIDPIFVEIIK